MKAAAKYYREIEYVEVSELPDVQRQLLKQYREADYIKILIDGTITGPCLQYKQYEAWYASIYAVAKKEKTVSTVVPLKRLVLDKV